MGNDRGIEALVRRFERAWRRGGRPEIGAFLGGRSEERLLVELICVDLEFRAKAGGSLRDYAGWFPGRGLPAEVVGEAYRARRLWGGGVTREAFLEEVGGGSGEVAEALRRVDREIAEEHGWDGDVPLVSDRDLLLRRLIGAGRMGKVYEAGWRGDGDVAVKFLRKGLLAHPGVVGRFLGEARTVGGLRHRNIVGLKGVGRTGGGSSFLVMELVRGSDLAGVMGRRAIAEGEVIDWGMQMCEALGHAHERGVVHCDLKPANVLLDAEGTVRVTDFGLARSLAGGTAWAAEVEGTAPYMAPEQVSRAWGPIDERTDVYGVGAVLFALLTGRPPVVGGTVGEILEEVGSARPVVGVGRFRAGISKGLEGVVGRCLEKVPGGRYQGVREVVEALAGLGGRS